MKDEEKQRTDEQLFKMFDDRVKWNQITGSKSFEPEYNCLRNAIACEPKGSLSSVDGTIDIDSSQIKRLFKLL